MLSTIYCKVINRKHSLCPSKCLYMKKYAGKKSLTTSRQQNDRRGKRPGHLIQSLLQELRKIATCTVIALYLLKILYFFTAFRFLK